MIRANNTFLFSKSFSLPFSLLNHRGCVFTKNNTCKFTQLGQNSCYCWNSIRRFSSSSSSSQPSSYEFGSTLQHNIDINVFGDLSSNNNCAPNRDQNQNSMPPATSYSKNVRIICTIGPACANEKILKEMIQSGMSIARLNFSHGTHEYHEQNIKLIRKVIAENFPQCHVAIALDTKGPEIRLGSFDPAATQPSTTPTNSSLEPAPPPKIHFGIGQQVKVTNNSKYRDKMTPELLFVDYPGLIAKSGTPSPSSKSSNGVHNSSSSPSSGGSKSQPDLHQQQVRRILIADGVLELKVVSTSADGQFLNCVVVCDASVGSKSNVNLPNVVTDLPAISDKDMKDLEFAAKMNIDMIFASFTRSAFHVRMIRELLRSNGSDAAIVAKIENHEGVDRIEEILEAADGIMVARGDLGVEIPPERVFLAQKKIISHCNIEAKPAIVATQMLESMTKNPRATRAEIADVANAVLDGCDVVMLSAESAAGLYPTRAVQTLSCTSDTAFKFLQHQKMLAQMISMNPSPTVINSTAAAAVLLSHQNKARAIITVTRSGRSVHELRKYSASVPIIAVCSDDKRARKLSLVRGVIPLYFSGIEYENFNELISKAIDLFYSGNGTDDDVSHRWIGLTLNKGDFVVVSCTDSKHVLGNEEAVDINNNNNNKNGNKRRSDQQQEYETFVKVIKL